MMHRAEFVFTVKEYESEQPWTMLDPLHASELPSSPDFFLGLGLHARAPLEKAEEFARASNDRIRFVTMTL